MTIIRVSDGCQWCGCDGCRGCSKHPLRACDCDDGLRKLSTPENKDYRQVFKEDDQRYNGKED